MITQIETIRKTRTFVLEQIKDLSAAQLNQIPGRFNNNIIWNLGHMIAAQQGICYKRAGLPTIIPDDFFEKYRTGSKPEGVVPNEEIIHIKQLLLTTLDQFERDYEKPIFGNYTAWSTRYGVEMSGIDDAIKFMPFHEGLHSGIIVAMKKLV